MIAVCAWSASADHLFPQTVSSHRQFWAGNLTYPEMQKSDPFAYPRLLNDYWQKGEDFAVLEPDIVIHSGVSDAFHHCPEPYCAFPYPWLTHVGPALGCTRFRAEFLSQFPEAMKKVLAQNVSWRQLDVVLMRHVLAGEYQQQPHVHLPPVEHLNPRKQAQAGAELTLEVPLR